MPENVREVSAGLLYRDFITVGLLLSEAESQEATQGKKLIEDNWIYIQEPDVQVGRLQIFNNWSPSLVGRSRARSGSAWNISATTPTTSGKSRTTT